MLVLPPACFKLDGPSRRSSRSAAVRSPVKDGAEESRDEAIEERVRGRRKKRIADHPPSEMAPVDEEDDQKPPPEEAVASPNDSADGPSKGIEAQRVDRSDCRSWKTVVTEQAEQKKMLDGVVQKADTFNTTLKATVTALPMSEDRPGVLHGCECRRTTIHGRAISTLRSCGRRSR